MGSGDTDAYDRPSSIAIEVGDYTPCLPQLIKIALWQIKPLSTVVVLPSLPFQKHSWLFVEFRGSYCVHVMDLHSTTSNQYFTLSIF
jgi:hypothetical protein